MPNRSPLRLGPSTGAIVNAAARHRRLLGVLAVGAGSTLGLAACSPTPANLGHGPLGISQATRAAGAVITIYDTGIVPTITHVQAGVNILVINAGGDSHSVTAFNGAFTTPILAGGQDDASFVINKPGTYRYYDELDTFRQGEIIVTPGPA